MLLRTLEHYYERGYDDALCGLPPDPFARFHEGRGVRWHSAVRWAYDAGHRNARRALNEREEQTHE